MPTGFFLDLTFESMEVRQQFTLLLHQENPHVERVVVAEGHVVVAST